MLVKNVWLGILWALLQLLLLLPSVAHAILHLLDLLMMVPLLQVMLLSVLNALLITI